MIQVLVAGNVPATLQIAARIPLRSVANKDGNLGRLRGASPLPKIMERGRGGRDSVEVYAQRNTDFQVCAPNRHSCLFCSYSNTAGWKPAGRTGKHACVPSASV